MNQLFERVESALRQVLRAAAEANKSATPTADAQVRAAALVSYALGSLQRFTRSGFKRSPLDHLDASLALML
jgi:TetR/AcrR family transcriptional regulator